MRLPPLEVLYSWPDPNYVDPVTRGSALLVVNCVFVSIAVLFVGARLYTRLWVKSWFGLDDVFIILAMVCIPRCSSIISTRSDVLPRSSP